jgi:hypothetical protein
MKLSAYAILLGAVVFSGCAVQNIPQKRPMQQAYIEQIKAPISVSTPDGQKGIATTFFAQDSSAAGAQYGLIGALTTAVIDGIANSTPASIAQDGANLINTQMQQPQLDQALVDALKVQGTASSKITIDLNQLNKVDLEKTKNAPVEGLLINSTYAFNQTAEVLRVSTTVTLNLAGVSYKTPYTFEKKIPKDQLTGPIYFNTFNYYSAVVPQPTKSKDDIAQAVADIEKKYTTSAGTPPKKGTVGATKLRKEIKAANNDFSPKEKFDMTLNEWLKDDAKKLKAEVQAANAFIAKQLILDLAFTETPSFNGANAVIETGTDGRTVTRIGSTLAAGSLESAPKEGLTDVHRNSFGWGRVYTYARDEAAEQARKDAIKAKRAARKKKR